jgi:SAM-dependent methyltransferase
LSEKNDVRNEWDEVYISESTPWDMSAPDVLLVSMVEQGELKPCYVLDIGCGTGNEALYLASRGFHVTGIDISPEALCLARKKTTRVKDRCKFVLADISEVLSLEREFDLVLDRACFHFIPVERHGIYLDNVSHALRRGGLCLLYIASDLDDETVGPYKYSKESIHRIFGSRLRILKIQLVRLEPHDLRPKAYFCVMKNDLDVPNPPAK